MAEMNTADNAIDVLPKHISDNLSSMVRHELVKLSAQKQEEFVEEYRRKEKSMGTAYLLWLFGFHYAYLGKWGLFILFCITLAGFSIWWFIDLFRVYGLIKNYNKDIAMDVFRNIKAISPGG